jgi:hypothetical protein
MGQFIDEEQVGMTLERGVHVEFLKRHPSMLDLPNGDALQPL